jgi:subtilase family serine protease
VVEIHLPVWNEGLLDARDFDVSLGIPQAIYTETVVGLQSGVARNLDPIPVTEAEWGNGNLFGQIDPDDRVAECNETDNLVSLGPWPCDDP